MGHTHDIAGVAGRLDDSLVQGEGLLGGVAGALLRLWLNRSNVLPDRVDWGAFLFVQVPLEERDTAGFGLHDKARIVSGLHPLTSPPPNPRHTKELILQVRSVLVWIRQIVKPIPPARFRFHMAIRPLHIFGVMRQKGPIP